MIGIDMAAAPTESRRASKVPARILIVDDDARDRHIQSSLLRDEANAVEFAETGREAIRMARDWKPDLVLLDILMPEPDGYEVCRQIRSDPATAEIRVFMLTSLDDRASRLRAFQAGADDFLTKPFNREELQARIQSIARLNRYRALIRHHQDSANSADPAATDTHLDAGYGQRLRSAIDRMEMWFQPIVRVTGEGLQSYAHEALLRTDVSPFQDPTVLLAAASRMGELSRLSAGIRADVARVAAKLPGLLFVNLKVSELLDAQLYDEENPLLAHADRVVLEITEREPIDDLADFSQRIARLRACGFRIAVDDLGGGYASLQSLVTLDPDVAKVDHSLIAAIDGDPRRQRLLASIAALCRDLGIEMVVEGVETEAEFVTLQKLGCVLMQGYRFGRPQPHVTAHAEGARP